MPEKMPETLNWKQACVVLGCSKTYFYNLVNCGQIPIVTPRLVGGIRVRKADCLAYLAEREKNL